MRLLPTYTSASAVSLVELSYSYAEVEASPPVRLLREVSKE